MKNTDPKVDDYIQQAAAFAQPILKHLRQLIHQACPEVIETIKWGYPSFEYAGSPIGTLAAFKKFATIRFHRGDELTDVDNLLVQIGKTSMKEISNLESLDQVPKEAVLIDFIQQAMALNEQGKKKAKKTTKKASAKELEVPLDLLALLEESPKAKATFNDFSPSKRKEYIEWIVAAKTEKTRLSRLATTIEWLEEGKSRNWKYQKK